MNLVLHQSMKTRRPAVLQEATELTEQSLLSLLPSVKQPFHFHSAGRTVYPPDFSSASSFRRPRFCASKSKSLKERNP